MRYDKCMNKITVLYARVSTEAQSIDSQVLALNRYCTINEIKDFKMLLDEGISGSKSSRPALNELMALVEQDKVLTIVTYSLSRLSRSSSHLLALLELFQRKNIEFISLTESISLKSPSGKMMVTILSALAEFERNLIIERTKAGLAAAVARGIKLGPQRRFINDDLLTELFHKGLSQRRIAELIGCSEATVSRNIKKLHGLKRMPL